MKSRLKSKKMIFHEWMLRTQMVVTERDAEIEDQMRRSEVLRICFQRWQEEVECEKILRQDALTWFHRGTQIDTKLATFKHWKNQLNLLHKANDFIKLKIRRQLKLTLLHAALLQLAQWSAWVLVNTSTPQKQESIAGRILETCGESPAILA
uniref:Sfi1 spindle body domain-containing protein n=1 Tax=Ciona savignyi TaxID=51511 RepID=H2Z415_CIOSA